MSSGEWLGVFCLTEVSVGTDASYQQTTAVFDKQTKEWILNGSKFFCY